MHSLMIHFLKEKNKEFLDDKFENKIEFTKEKNFSKILNQLFTLIKIYDIMKKYKKLRILNYGTQCKN